MNDFVESISMPRSRAGRPPRRKVASAVYVTIRCTKSERERWHGLARAENLSLAELVRRELEKLESSTSARKEGHEP